MTDNITLPRVAAEKLGKLVALPENIDKFWKDNDYAALAALAALATALAEPEPESDAQCPTCGGGGLVPDPTWDWVRCDVCNPLPEKPEPTVKESLTVDAKREPATEEVIEAKFEKCFYVHPEALDDFAEGWCEAERFHGIRKEDGK